MELRVLGSGTAVPHPARGAAGYAVRFPSGVLLLDTGPGSYRRWPSAGIRPDEVRWIASTHHHVDHSADLPAILFACRVPQTPRPERLVLVGPPGHAAFVASLAGVWRDWLDAKGYERTLVELPDGARFEGDGFALVARQALHTQPAVSYRVESGGRSLVYSGDSGPCDSLALLAKDADVALFDCSMPDGHEFEGHMTPGQAGEIARRARVQRLVLVHLYPACDGVDVAAQARARFGGEVTVAADGLTIVIP
jgi:ribonuclease BN (tRNA processing enzyme)